MQINSDNKNRIFISEDLEEIVDINNLSNELESEILTLSLDGKKSSVLSYEESLTKCIITIKTNEKTLEKLILKQINSISLNINKNCIFSFVLKDILLKYKIKSLSKNNYKIRLYLGKNKEK